ncbi:MAG: c-type cytochrome [Janthinobacterium lividum]
MTYRATLPFDAAAIASGDALFKSNCVQCHGVSEKVVGPALAGILLRRRLPWVTAWVHNSAKVVAGGDDYAVKLFNDNGKQQMPAFPQLSDKDIKNILTWVESQQETNVSVSAQAVAAR